MLKLAKIVAFALLVSSPAAADCVPLQPMLDLHADEIVGAVDLDAGELARAIAMYDAIPPAASAIHPDSAAIYALGHGGAVLLFRTGDLTCDMLSAQTASQVRILFNSIRGEPS